MGYKPTSEWKEEHVFWDPLGSAKLSGQSAPGSAVVTTAVIETNTNPPPAQISGPLNAVFPDGTAVQIPADRDPREVFADWLITPDNPWFTRCAVNRTWAWLLGRGIIHEPDDIRDDNPPANPELLAWLEEEFVRSGYDMKHLIRLILNSKTYQLSSVSNTEHPEAAAQFAAYPIRRLEAEVLIDAVNDITGSSDLYTSAIPEPFTYIPKEQSAVSIADGSITSPFLSLFGRSARATGKSDERINKTSPSQQLHIARLVDDGALPGAAGEGVVHDFSLHHAALHLLDLLPFWSGEPYTGESFAYCKNNAAILIVPSVLLVLP